MTFWRKFKNTVHLSFISFAALIVIIPLILILVFIFKMGANSLNWDFFTQLPAPVGGEGGGMKHAILGTLYLVGLACLFSIPIGVCLGAYLAEYSQERMAIFLRQTIDLLTGVPAIIIGIFAYVIAVLPLKKFSALSGSIALSFIILPIIVKTSEAILLLTSASIKEAGLALGLSRTQVIWHILIKGNRSSLLTGIMLAISRAAGETAPLLFTAFGNNLLSFDLLSPMASLPVQIYTYAISPFEEWQRQAWTGSLVLMILVLGLNLSARFFMRKKT